MCSKASDTINHCILLNKLLTEFNFSSNSTRLMSSYLVNRRQAVAANNQVSSMAKVFNGVPQGSVMGPLLFQMYINDLSNTINKFNDEEQDRWNSFRNISFHMYADDVQLLTSCSPSEVPVCVQHINKCLTSVFDWANKNKLSLNASKTKCIAISRKKFDTDSICLMLNNTKIDFVDKVRNLGLAFNNFLN